jgi:Protein of unknown function (DUF2924)
MTPLGSMKALERLTLHELRRRYAELFGETTTAKNRTWLLRRVAWRLQSLAEGDLSQRARQRAAELANDADLRITPPRVQAPRPAVAAPRVPAAIPVAVERSQPAATPSRPDPRLPLPGTVLTRMYKGQALRVEVLAQGFAYAGQTYQSLSAVAKAITGAHCNGFWFFRLGQPGGSA